MKASLGLGLAGLTAVTALSVGMSIVIPAQNTRAARAETSAAWSLARSALMRSGTSCAGPQVAYGGLVAKVGAQASQCVARVTIPEGSSVPAQVRGARLEATVRDGRIRCRAQGGHGAGVSDFPAVCRYRPTGMLL